MNIKEAKSIPLELLTEKLGGRYSHTDRKGDLWYYSPFRPEEKTASFKINTKRNLWHDFGLSSTFAHIKQGNGGSIIDLWCDYYMKDRRTSVKEALQALTDLSGLVTHHRPINNIPAIPSTARYEITRIADRVTFSGLKEELVRRRISLKLADLYLKQGHILDTETGYKYTGFLFENDLGGYEVSIPNPKKKECFKICIGKKASTRILVNDERNSADVFEGFWDFLSWLEFKAIVRPINHTYVLNSTSMVAETCDKIVAFKDSIKYAFLFMDNDEAGYIATHAIASKLEEEGISVGSIEQFYKGAKDFGEFWANGLKPTV